MKLSDYDRILSRSGILDSVNRCGNRIVCFVSEPSSWSSGKKAFFIDKYNQHVKNLVNSIHDECPNSRSNGKIPYYLEKIEDSSSKRKMIQHFYTFQKNTKDSSLYDEYISCIEKQEEITAKMIEIKKIQDNPTVGNNRIDVIALNKKREKLENQHRELRYEFGKQFKVFHSNVNSAIIKDFGACPDCIELNMDKKIKKEHKKLLQKLNDQTK